MQGKNDALHRRGGQGPDGIVIHIAGHVGGKDDLLASRAAQRGKYLRKVRVQRRLKEKGEIKALLRHQIQETSQAARHGQGHDVPSGLPEIGGAKAAAQIAQPGHVPENAAKRVGILDDDSHSAPPCTALYGRESPARVFPVCARRMERQGAPAGRHRIRTAYAVSAGGDKS